MNDGHNRKQPARYADAGVDIDAGNRLVDMIGPAVRSTERTGSVGAIGGFGGLFDLKATGYDDPLLVSATDGVGTKLRLAIDTGKLDTIGIDLVAMCVNDLVVQGAEPLFFLDYYATGRLDPEAAAQVVTGIAEGCRQAGAALVGGETAEMPGLYSGDDFDLAGFAVGAVERTKLLPRPDVAPGDVILGLASSGVHSNGYSLVRRLIDQAGLDLSAPAPFDPEISAAEAFLTPTRIYVRSLLEALKSGAGIKALAHVTGGGISENLPRVLPDGCVAAVNLGALPTPPVLTWLRQTGAMETQEFLRTFNAGIGMFVICAEADADAVTATLTAQGESVHHVGLIEAGDGAARVRTYGDRVA